MDTALLPTTSNSQSQTNTQSPQANVQPINSGTQTNNVQPGTANGLLNGQGSATLNNPALPSISLNAGGNTAPATTATAAAPAHKHHLNPVLLGFPVVLVAVAVVLIWAINHSAKNAAA